MAYTWKLSEIKTRWRALTGLSSTNDISDSELGNRLNDYYVNHFPRDARIDEFDTFFTQATTATDDGEYTLDSTVDRLDEPVTVNGNEVRFYRDKEYFFRHYPEDEQYITAPTLVIGTDDTTMVKHSAFDYLIQGDAYSKASSEVDLTDDAIPAGKYGAWSLKIDEDGDITVASADDNATGYDTPKLALEGLNNADSESCYIGYVTVMKSDGAFTPATTALDADNVTATYTDGKFENRNVPEAILLYGTKLYARPKPNDIYQIRSPSISERPSAFASDEAVPADVKHGPMIALGDAILYLNSIGNTDKANELLRNAKYYLGSIREDKTRRMVGREVLRRF